MPELPAHELEAGALQRLAQARQWLTGPHSLADVDQARRDLAPGAEAVFILRAAP